MFDRLGTIVSRHWLLVLAAWVAVVAWIQWKAPNWEDITHDGDFAYLPARMTSVRGEKLLEAAFPEALSKSQVVLIVARPKGKLRGPDFELSQRLREQFTPAAEDQLSESANGPITSVWDYDSQVVGQKLISRAGSRGQAVLIVLQLSSEFMAVGNIDLVSKVIRTVDVVQLEGGIREILRRQTSALEEAAQIPEEEPGERARLAEQVRQQQIELRQFSIGLLKWLESVRYPDRTGADQLADEFDRVLRSLVFGEMSEAVRQSGKLAEVHSPEGFARPIAQLRQTQDQTREVLQELLQVTDELLSEMKNAPHGVLPDETEEKLRQSLSETGRLVVREQRLTEAAKHLAKEPPQEDFPSGLQLGITGSAAVGYDFLCSAAESIDNTEKTTIVLVVLILLLVYRAPGLVIVPLTTIAVSVCVAKGAVAMLARLAMLAQHSGRAEWFDFKVFSTTEIFIIVILFGAGTDYCLFLISRYREELHRGRDPARAIAVALAQVGDALAASALTTIFGLGMMFFADFGKFSNSGPAIALCLLVALLACVTLAPALLRATGRIVFWPFAVGQVRRGKTDQSQQGGSSQDGKGPEATGSDASDDGRMAGANRGDAPEHDAVIGSPLFRGFWQRLSRAVIARPGLILVVSVLLLAPLVVAGFSPTITYDLRSELDPKRPSVQGTRLLSRHFLTGETGPVTVLAHQPGTDFDSTEGRHKISLLTKALYDLEYEVNQDGETVRTSPILSVRSLTEPLGDPPGSFSPLSEAGLRKLAVLRHPKTKAAFRSQAPPYEGNVTRFDLIFQYDPFSRDSIGLLNYVEERLDGLSNGSLAGWPEPSPDLPEEKQTERSEQLKQLATAWQGATFELIGTTAGIRDLKAVTRTDQIRIQVLVVIAVLAVLILILRRPVICVYLILSVLVGYFVTIGVTELLFSWVYGETFEGLDWKVPIFLFVILVAIGEDYNIYLTTRVFEEQRRIGPLEGLRVALVRTGGIITSCGVIMAGTFASMITGTLRTIQVLGFALAFGVLLDTFVIRTILVPAFLTLLARRRTRMNDKG